MFYNPNNEDQYDYSQDQYEEQMDMNNGMYMNNGMDMDDEMGMDMDDRMGMDRGMYMGMRRGIYGRDVQLTDDIAKAIEGEVHAYNDYERLARMTENERDRQTILGIQRDEAKHYRWFTMILRSLGGEMPRIPRGTMPKDFEEGIREAINDELEAVAFYQDIADRAYDRNIQMHFMHASHDEQRHATLLMNMLLNMHR
jgi:rubrerythrin